MKKILLLCLLLLAGAECLKLNRVQTFEEFSSNSPVGFESIKIADNLAMRIRSDKKLSLNNISDAFYEDDVGLFYGTADEIEQQCINNYGARYLDSPNLGKTKSLIQTLDRNGLTAENRDGLLHLDATGDCGWHWSPSRIEELDIEGYNGIVQYGCRGTDTCATPESTHVNVVLTKDGKLTSLVFNAKFGRLDETYYYSEDTPSTYWNIATDGIVSALLSAPSPIDVSAKKTRECNDYKDLNELWLNYLCNNLDEIAYEISTITTIK